jgi:hypothetical protein
MIARRKRQKAKGIRERRAARPAVDDIPVITPEMIEAGTQRYYELDEFKAADSVRLVSEVFRAMWAAHRHKDAHK